MKVIGEKLKTSREEKGLSLEEVSEDLKIKVEDLKNIELGNKDSFQDIYFLKKAIYDYAKYLGLDYEQLIEEFNEFMFECTSKIPVDVIEKISKQKEEAESNKKALSPYTKDPVNNNKKKLIILGIIILLLVGIITSVILIKEKNSRDNDRIMASLL